MSRDCGHLDMFIKIVFDEIRTVALQESMKDSYSHLGTAVLWSFIHILAKEIIMQNKNMIFHFEL